MTKNSSSAWGPRTARALPAAPALSAPVMLDVESDDAQHGDAPQRVEQREARGCRAAARPPAMARATTPPSRPKERDHPPA